MSLKWKHDIINDVYMVRKGPFIFNVREDWNDGWCWSVESKDHETGWRMGQGSITAAAAKKKVYTWCKRYMK